MEDQLIRKLNNLYLNNYYDEAREIIYHFFNTKSAISESKNLVFKTHLIGFLIDISWKTLIEDDLLFAIDFFQRFEEELKKHFSQSSYYYNLANAKQALARLYISKNNNIPNLDTLREKFQEPINYYWLAYKSSNESDSEIYHQILINLSISLGQAGRVVESLQFLDLVLRKNPTFSQAQNNRGDFLYYLTEVSNCSLNSALYKEIYTAYNNAINSKQMPSEVLKASLIGRKIALEEIKKQGFDICNFDKEVNETLKEYLNHSPYRKFSIQNFLTLNEHGIYCNCVANEKDDLQIGVQHGLFFGKVVPKLELLLNRIKSEFTLARWLYYQSVTAEDPFENDAKFSELLDGEIISSKSEMLRTSFRISYGILDKIALGICKLYNLNSKRIYFESFLEDPKRRESCHQIKNIHLNALYSISCDLNSQYGELKHFKNWRNKLEHNLLVLKNKKRFDPDILQIFTDPEFAAIADYEDFQKATLHLLQLTRSAIFSYVYSVRFVTIQDKADDFNEPSFNVKFKI